MKFVLVIVLIPILICCKKGDTIDTLSNEINVSKIFIPKVYDWNPPYETSYQKGDTTITINISKLRYIETRKLPDTLFAIRSEFDIETRQVRRIDTIFGRFGIGIRKEYDQNGKLVLIRDFDRDYTFSVSDVLLKCKRDWNIDISKPSDSVWFDRLPSRKTLIRENAKYRIHQLISSGRSRFVEIDGKTGDVLEDKIVRNQDCE